MQKIKIFSLYAMLVLFIAVGVFCVYQMCFTSEEVYVQADEEDPYEFESMQSVTVKPLPKEPVQDVFAADVVPEPVETYVLEYDAEALKAENQDFIGWLMIPDTTVNYPVVLGDDNQHYLKHGFSGKYSRYGCPFLDTRTPVEGECRIIHGHNMGNNRTEMFSPLANFQNTEFAVAHKTALFSVPGTEDGETYELFAVVNQQLNQDFEYIVSDFESEDARNTYIKHLKDHSLYETDFVPKGKILILSTCNNTYGTDNRLLICLGLV